MLTNPINSQNLVERFAQYVQATANSGISWGTNAVPFAEFPVGHFGGTTAGRGIEVNGNTIGAPGTVVTAANIFNVLVAETNRYTRIRNLRARRILTGNVAPAGVTFDQTLKSHMNANFTQGVPATSNIGSGQTITATGLETLFNNLRTWYSNAAANTVQIDVTVCHASCHSQYIPGRNRR